MEHFKKALQNIPTDQTPHSVDLIIAFEFQVGVDPEHVELLEDVEHDEARGPGPRGDGDEAHDVPAETDEGFRGPRHQDAVQPELGMQCRISTCTLFTIETGYTVIKMLQFVLGRTPSLYPG